MNVPSRTRSSTAVLLASGLLATVSGCTHATPPSSRTVATTPSSRPTEATDVRYTFTEMCLTFSHRLAADATSRLNLSLVSATSYASQQLCDPQLTGVDRHQPGQIRVVFDRELTAEQQTQATVAAAEYPEAALVIGSVQGISVAFTVVPAAHSPLAERGGDAQGFQGLDSVGLGKVLGVFGTGRDDSTGAVRVTYFGSALTPVQVRKVRQILAVGAGVQPVAITVTRYVEPG